MGGRVIGRACWLLVLLSLLGAVAEPGARAQSASGWDWEPTGVTEPAWRLFTPASGALFALTGRRGVSDHVPYVEPTGLLRSDDAGATWRPVELPPEPKAVAVDPTNHAILYALARGGLHRTEDDRATWQVIASESPARGSFVVVGAADPRRVYVGYARWPNGPTGFFVGDGPGAWEPRSLETGVAGRCGWSYLRPHDFLVPDGGDPARVYMAGSCSGGGTVLVSADRGERWNKLFEAPRQQVYLASNGGRVAAGRLYLAAHSRGTSVSPEGFACCATTRLLRSDDGGGTWSERRSWSNEGTEAAANVYSHLGKEFGAVTYDPDAPDRVYVGLTFSGGGVQASADGGDTWADLGRQELGEVHDLALGLDGAYLYAATDRGVYRLRLH